MHAVADQFGVEAVAVERDAEDARLAMIERTHRVEGVRRAACAGIDRGVGLGCERVGVAQRAAHAHGGCIEDEIDRAARARERSSAERCVRVRPAESDRTARCSASADGSLDGHRALHARGRVLRGGCREAVPAAAAARPRWHWRATPARAEWSRRTPSRWWEDTVRRRATRGSAGVRAAPRARRTSRHAPSRRECGCQRTRR